MGGDEALAPLTEAQAADLDRVVAELRVVLPDPTARDIHDYIEENMAASMGEWATANRVKKVNTRMNKAARAKAGVDRDMLEPDETDGPVVLEELGTWPEDTSLEEHLAEDEDTRIFSPDEHRAPVEGEDVAGGPSTALAYRRSLVACGKFWDGKLKVWRLHDHDHDDAGAGAGGDPDELLVLCRAVQIPTSIPALAWSLKGDEFDKFLIEHARGQLLRISETLPSNLVGDIVAEIGQPADVVTRAAKERRGDLIVIGSHGYSGIDRMIGTTASRIVNRSPISVMVVREH